MTFVLCIQQVLDGQYHMFVLEGLAEKGIRRLWEKLPRPQEEGKILRSKSWQKIAMCLCVVEKLFIRELKHRRFLSHGRQPEVETSPL